MIAPMQKAYLVAHKTDRDRLLDTLGALGVLHLQPVDPAQAVASEKTLAQIDHLGRAIQVLQAIEPDGPAPETDPLQAAEEVLRMQRESAEHRSHLSALHRQVEQLEMWGDVRLEQFKQLSQHGLEIRFFAAPAEVIDQFQADLVHVVGPLPRKCVLVGVVLRQGCQDSMEIPDQADPIELPAQDRPALRQEAQQIDQALKQNAQRLKSLAGLVDPMQQLRNELQQNAEYTVAQRGGWAEENLFAVQGFLPSDHAASLTEDLTVAGIEAAVQLSEPDEEDRPPTLIRYPRWARPIKGLFDLLGTLPGYAEFDISPFFMIALPIFAAMLIGDAGYGLLFVLLPGLFYRKVVAKLGKVQVQLLMVLGVATMIWGVLAGNLFGVTPAGFVSAGGIWATFGAWLDTAWVIRGDVEQQAQTIMKISFVMAAIHLSAAQLRQAVAVAPSVCVLSKIGWAVFLWGIFFVIWYLMFDSQAQPPRPAHPLTVWLLGIGGGLAILFASPSRNPLKMLGLGLADFPLSALATFSDSISYVRLMGVGLASTIIAQTFNSLGAQVADSATWFVGALVVLPGHALNIAMCAIAILAHGVRLNMLEFSNNAGVQWAGYPYKPFAISSRKEQ